MSALSFPLMPTELLCFASVLRSIDHRSRGRRFVVGMGRVDSIRYTMTTINPFTFAANTSRRGQGIGNTNHTERQREVGAGRGQKPSSPTPERQAATKNNPVRTYDTRGPGYITEQIPPPNEQVPQAANAGHAVAHAYRMLNTSYLRRTKQKRLSLSHTPLDLLAGPQLGILGKEEKKKKEKKKKRRPIEKEKNARVRPGRGGWVKRWSAKKSAPHRLHEENLARRNITHSTTFVEKQTHMLPAACRGL